MVLPPCSLGLGRFQVAYHTVAGRQGKTKAGGFFSAAQMSLRHRL
jgi:hypothetical protein